TPIQVHTHDGERTFGAYGFAMRSVGRSETSKPEWTAARLLHEELQSINPSDIWFVGEDSSFRSGKIGWRYLRLLLARDGLRGRIVAPHTLLYTVGVHRAIFTVPSQEEKDLAARLAPNALRIEVSSDGETPEQILKKIQEQLAAFRDGFVVRL